MALDLRAIKADAAARLAGRAVATLASVANAANPAIRASQLAALAGSATDAQRYRDTLARLLRWGWPQDDAEATARRIAERDPDDDRRTCMECAHHRPGRCGNHRAAGLYSPEVGRDLAALPQRCPAHRKDHA